jgi:hypothetical protein
MSKVNSTMSIRSLLDNGSFAVRAPVRFVTIIERGTRSTYRRSTAAVYLRLLRKFSRFTLRRQGSELTITDVRAR